MDNLDKRVIEKTPDAVIIEFAINDAFLQYKTSPEDARKNLENMIDRIKKARPQCEIILMTMNPPIREHLERRPKIEDYYEMYRKVAKDRSLLLIDHYPNWQKILKDDPDTFNKYVPDGIHPNTLGCEKIIMPQLLKSLGIE
ncbi:MAG: SGNH/GDSL hydrolase family protein [Candidatus Sumerlaeota bacterium]|nr:SGNH/GDSL hydrolase family protein [Candidatus Sumerlaeota bacterium]